VPARPAGVESQHEARRDEGGGSQSDGEEGCDKGGGGQGDGEGHRDEGDSVSEGRYQPGAQRLRVRENEKPWTVKELAAVRAELEADIARLTREISVAEVDLAGLMRDVVTEQAMTPRTRNGNLRARAGDLTGQQRS